MRLRSLSRWKRQRSLQQEYLSAASAGAGGRLKRIRIPGAVTKTLLSGEGRITRCDPFANLRRRERVLASWIAFPVFELTWTRKL